MVRQPLRLSGIIRTRLSGRLIRSYFLLFIDGRQPIKEENAFWRNFDRQELKDFIKI